MEYVEGEGSEGSHVDQNEKKDKASNGSEGSDVPYAGKYVIIICSAKESAMLFIYSCMYVDVFIRQIWSPL